MTLYFLKTSYVPGVGLCDDPDDPDDQLANEGFEALEAEQAEQDFKALKAEQDLEEEQNAQAERADRLAAVQTEFRFQALAQAKIDDERKSPAKEAYLQAHASMCAARTAREAYEHATEEGTSSYDALQMKALDEKAKKAEETCKEAWEAAYL